MSTESIMSLSDQFVMKTYGRLPLAFVRGQGAKVWDADGREYLDFLGGLAVNILGHAHPGVAKAVAEQAATLIHVSNLYYIEAQAKLAEKLCSGSGLGKAFFCNSGAEANEAAIKLARRYQKVHNQPDRVEIITLLNSFHGRTLATITATGQPKYQKGFEPLPAGFAHVPINDVAALEAAVGEKTAAVMVEVIQGEGGVNMASAEYLRQVQALCRKSGALMIIDEVQTGMGRT
ncbi:MAG TPA: aminotransferase class III-fold pyridoxal phosphate-dependent enzyme, partial [Limnochordia bacterium]|nr:aminotransferase class III-fold pyridoxal phosphate-dependent enzyme [Limnochordia bacterium]